MSTRRPGHALVPTSGGPGRASVTVGCTVPTGLPAGPSQPPSLQTLRWLLRPISFLESCRRRFGDAFSVRLLGFQTPLVMLSDPEVIRALYGNRAHGLPPGRSPLNDDQERKLRLLLFAKE